MAKTLTGSLATANASPRSVESGLFGQVFRYVAANGTGDVTANDIIYLGKIGHGVTVVGGWAQNGGEQFGTAIGTSDDPDRFATTATFSAGITPLRLGFPYTVSVSDDASTRFVYLVADIENDISTSSTITVHLVMQMGE